MPQLPADPADTGNPASTSTDATSRTQPTPDAGPTAKPARRRGTVPAALGWVLLVPVLLVLFLRLSGWQVGTPWVQLLSLTPMFIVPALGALLFFAAARRRIPALFAAASAAALAVLLVAPFAGSTLCPIQDPGTQQSGIQQSGTQAAGNQDVRMMSLNARLGRADAVAIVDTVRRENVQLLAIQEFTPTLGAALTAAGLDELLPHTHQVPEGGAAGAGTYAAYPLTARAGPGIGSMAFENPTVALRLPGSAGRARTLELTNVHTFPPLPDAVDSWRHDVAALAGVNAAGGTRVLAGDFNATYDHREFRDLLHANPESFLSDASAGSLARLQPTWPREPAWSPGIVIDHVLTSPEISTCGYATARIPGSDHAAVLVTLRLR